MSLDDFLGEGQADPGPGILLPRVKALKDHEHFLPVLRLNADAIVAHDDMTRLLFPSPRDVNLRLDAGAVKLEGVANEVLQKLHELHPVPENYGQGLTLDNPSGIGDCLRQVRF